MARNILRLMQSHPNIKNPRQLALQSGLSPSTIKRAFEEDGGVSVDTLQAMADALDVQAFHLLVPDVDRDNLPDAPVFDQNKFREPTDYDLLQSAEMTRWIKRKPDLNLG